MRSFLVLLCVVLTPAASWAGLLYFEIEGRIERFMPTMSTGAAVPLPPTLGGPAAPGSMDDTVKIRGIFRDGVFGGASGSGCSGVAECTGYFDTRSLFLLEYPSGTLTASSGVDDQQLFFSFPAELRGLQLRFDRGYRGASATVSSRIEGDATVASFDTVDGSFDVRFDHSALELYHISRTPPEMCPGKPRERFVWLTSLANPAQPPAMILAPVGENVFAPYELVDGVESGCLNRCIQRYYRSGPEFTFVFGEHVFTNESLDPDTETAAEFYFTRERQLTQIDMNMELLDGSTVTTSNGDLTTAAISLPSGTIFADFDRADFRPEYLTPAGYGEDTSAPLNCND